MSGLAAEWGPGTPTPSAHVPEGRLVAGQVERRQLAAVLLGHAGPGVPHVGHQQRGAPHKGGDRRRPRQAVVHLARPERPVDVLERRPVGLVGSHPQGGLSKQRGRHLQGGGQHTRVSSCWQQGGSPCQPQRPRGTCSPHVRRANVATPGAVHAASCARVCRVEVTALGTACAHLVSRELRALGPLLPVPVKHPKQAVLRVVAERGQGDQGVLVVLRSPGRREPCQQPSWAGAPRQGGRLATMRTLFGVSG